MSETSSSASSVGVGRSVLIVDDDAAIVRMISRMMENEGWMPTTAASAEEALELIAKKKPEAILLDWHLPGMNGIDAIRHFTNRAPEVPVVMLTGDQRIEGAVEAMKAGAVEFLTKPVDRSRLLVSIGTALRLYDERRQRRVLEKTLDQVAGQSPFPEILSCSPAMAPVFRLMERVLDRNLTVLINGESGTGKELVAQAIHNRGKRSRAPFIVLNCAALPENLVESELFGHEKGAFTGAAASRPGHVEMADGGTLFLDEVGDMPLHIQPKFLRCLQDGKVQRIGSSQVKTVDFRLISATNRNLMQDVVDNKFREDLFYRLAVFPIQLPPLRERREDILMLTRHFLEKSGRERMWIEPAAAAMLEAHSWPGNVRELQNLMARLSVVVEGDRLTADVLAVHLRTSSRMVELRSQASQQQANQQAADARAALASAIAGSPPPQPGMAPNTPAGYPRAVVPLAPTDPAEAALPGGGRTPLPLAPGAPQRFPSRDLNMDDPTAPGDLYSQGYGTFPAGAPGAAGPQGLGSSGTGFYAGFPNAGAPGGATGAGTPGLPAGAAGAGAGSPMPFVDPYPYIGLKPPQRSEIRPLADLERMAIDYAMKACNGNVTEAARALGIGRATLYRYLKSHQLTEYLEE